MTPAFSRLAASLAAAACLVTVPARAAGAQASGETLGGWAVT
jgi:hypothetical protein